MDACTVISWGHFFMSVGMLFIGIAFGLARNLESIGCVARWKAAIEREGLSPDAQTARLDTAMNERWTQ